MITLPAYCHDPFRYRRRQTRVVHIGDVPLGGNYPIRIQSMTISDTMDTAATVAETIQLVEAGCEIVRITAPSLNEAENLRHIKAELHRRGIRVPLIADIHFTPNAALKAAEYVEKVRINPGNYADKKKFATHEYSDSEYQAELERIDERFKPLVLKLKQYGVAMRIGTNHGSLSDRIMNRFGDTPEGMVESALEFVRICERYDYHDIVLSMKASNPLVMIQAYRLLAARMAEEGMDYPFHLGVTEAGDGEEGRVKSAMGIGSLLEDGIGDTIRVSLTEDSVHEIPAAYAIARPYNARLAAPDQGASLPVRLSTRTAPLPQESRNPYGYRRRPSDEVRLGDLQVGGAQPVQVELATTVPLADVDGTLAQIRALSTPAHSGAPVCEMVCLQATSDADLEAFARLRQRLPEAGLSVPLSLRLPLALLGSLPTLPEVAKLITAPDPMLPEGPWHEQVRRGAALVARHGVALEWMLTPGDDPPLSACHVWCDPGRTGIYGQSFSRVVPRGRSARRRRVCRYGPTRDGVSFPGGAPGRERSCGAAARENTGAAEAVPRPCSRGRSGWGHCCVMASVIACRLTATSLLPRLSVSATISCKQPGCACRRPSSSPVPPVAAPCSICRRPPSALSPVCRISKMSKLPSWGVL